MTKIAVTKEGSRYVARFDFSYAIKDLVKAAGFRFNGENKTWYTENKALGEALLGTHIPNVFTSLVNDARLAEHARQQQAITDSRASSSDFAIPLSDTVKAKGWNFFPFQRAGVEYAMDRAGVLIADEMGLGKTMQAIGIINCDPSVHRVLVICKASLKLNWLRECKTWLARGLRPAITNGLWPDKANVIITNYEQVAKYREQIMRESWDVLIVDESHMIKNPKAQRTHAILGSRDESGIKAKRRVFLTGTPILNRPTELWTLVHALDPQGLGASWRRFHDRYCGPSRGFRGRTDYTGASNLDELQAKLRGSIMVRRMKADVLPELPPVRRQIITLQAPINETERAALAHESEVVKIHEAKEAEARAKLAALSEDQASEAYKQAVRNLRQVQGVAFTETAIVRHEVALAKLPRVVEQIRDFLDETGQKLVVMAHHHDVVDGIAEALTGAEIVAITCDGRDSHAVRDDRVQSFQTHDSVRVIICGMQSMAEGHTLTQASTVIFAELDWVPGKLSQAEARCHRIGQHDSVLAQHIVLDGSLDCRMAGLLVEKQAVIDAALNTPSDALPAVSLLDAPAIPDETPKRISGAPKPTQSPSWNMHPMVKPESSEEVLTEAQIIAVLTAVQQLAGMCDGAFQLDGMGFNKFDSRFGKEMAGHQMLTQGQARACRKMVLKYQRQLAPGLVAAIKG